MDFERRTFSSYEEFEKHLFDFQKSTNTVYRKQSSETVESCNRKTKFQVPGTFRYSRCKFVCTHFGNHVYRGKGVKSRTKSAATGCDACFTLNFDYHDRVLVVKNMKKTHNHPTTPETYARELKVKRLSPQERKEVQGFCVGGIFVVEERCRQENRELISDKKSRSAIVGRSPVDVVIPAAGSSTRMGGGAASRVPKQFQKVLGTHLIAYTVHCFHRIPWIRHIVLVVSPSEESYVLDLVTTYGWSKVKVCPGSHTRHRSIRHGVEKLKDECSADSVVIIHDGARPFVPEDIIEKVATTAQKHGAAGVTRPLVSTVLKPDSANILTSTLTRSDYANSEMPQAFQYGVVHNAYQKCSESDLDHGTECLLLALQYSQCAAHLVEGCPDLWKVTYAKDLYTMESMVRERLMCVSVVNQTPDQIRYLDGLHKGLEERNIRVSMSKLTASNTVICFVNLPSSSPYPSSSSRSSSSSPPSSSSFTPSSSLISTHDDYWLRQVARYFHKLSWLEKRLGLFILMVFQTPPASPTPTQPQPLAPTPAPLLERIISNFHNTYPDNNNHDDDDEDDTESATTPAVSIESHPSGTLHKPHHTIQPPQVLQQQQHHHRQQQPPPPQPSQQQPPPPPQQQQQQKQQQQQQQQKQQRNQGISSSSSHLSPNQPRSNSNGCTNEFLNAPYTSTTTATTEGPTTTNPANTTTTDTANTKTTPSWFHLPLCQDYMYGLRQTLASNSNSIPDVCIMGIVNQLGHDVTERLVELIWSRSRVLNGQVLLVDQ